LLFICYSLLTLYIIWKVLRDFYAGSGSVNVVMEDTDDISDELMLPSWVDKDCTSNCSSTQHATQLITAVSKATSWQSLLFLSRCHNFGTVSDTLGRTVLHVAASCGSPSSLIKILMKHSNLSAQDAESGWTPLHRALFHGQLSVARLLIAVSSFQFLLFVKH